MRSFKVFIAAMVAFALVAGAAMPATAAEGDVVGEVSDSDDALVEGANVTLYNSSDDTEVASTTTAEDGTYQFDAVADGDYRVEVVADGYNTTDKTVTHNSSEETTVDFTLELDGDWSVFLSETYDVDSDDSEIYVDIDDSNGSDVRVKFIAIDEDDNRSHADTQVVNSTDEIVTASIDVDSDNVSSYEVIAEGPEEPEHIESGTMTKLSGGGGNALEGDLFGVPNWILGGVVLLGVGLLLGQGRL